MSKMPKVFEIKRTINQIFWLRRADCQRAYALIGSVAKDRYKSQLFEAKNCSAPICKQYQILPDFQLKWYNFTDERNSHRMAGLRA